jgi:hypothetical protein
LRLGPEVESDGDVENLVDNAEEPDTELTNVSQV